MKTIKNSKDITTLEVGDKVVFGDLEYEVHHGDGYYLNIENDVNSKIFTVLNIDRKDFVNNLGIATLSHNWIFPETKSLEALTAIVSALFREYERQNQLPKTWEEFCEKYPIKAKEAYITADSEVCDTFNSVTTFNSNLRHCYFDKNLCTSKQEAEAFLALMQLRQLRKAYVKDWEPDWGSSPSKFCIIVDVDKIRVADYYVVQKSLSFPTCELAEQFLTNFKDLLEIAKPLL